MTTERLSVRKDSGGGRSLDHVSTRQLRKILESPLTGAAMRERIEAELAAREERADAPADEARMNKTEARYADHLEALKRAGKILRWDYEPEKLRLATGAFYTPDFRVVLPDGTVEFHEVKGRKGESFYAREDAKLKVRFAPEKHPYRFFIVWPQAGGRGWERREFTAHAPQAVHARAAAGRQHTES